MGALIPAAMRLVRGARGLTQTDLAKAAGVSQPAVSQWENGTTSPGPDLLEKLAQALDVLPTVLTDETVGITRPMYRATGIRKKSDELRITGRTELARIAAARIVEHAELSPALPWPDVDDPLPDDPEEAASRLRTVWRILPGPVDDLLERIEAAGGIGLRVDFGHSKVDAAYARFRRDPIRWMLFNTTTSDGARFRLNVAHELGHAMLHHWDSFDVVDERQRESEAFRFGIALLVPREDFIREIAHTRMRWDDFLHMRPRWGVSAAALARRARDLHLISPDAYTRLNIERRKRGHWTREPFDVPLERPKLFERLIDMLRESAGWGPDDFAQAAGLPYLALADLLPDQFPNDRPPARLRETGLRLVT
ncbi:MAG: helix-turn-helix domain-containing protein [Solirubrobacteraceae bacterium]|nr:helix-turn-helix domain-containing protein [Solirubrobacteraceae bacterium]